MISLPARNLGIFRLLFGLLMIPQIYGLTPHVHDLANSCIVFHYPGLSLIEAYSHELIDFLAGMAYVGACLLAVGILPRIGAGMFLAGFGYLFLIDISFYNNHYYLWCLIAFLFLFVNHRNLVSPWKLFSVESKSMEIEARSYIHFGLLISIVYFYGGVAKLNTDWLQGYPMRLMTESKNYPAPEFLGFFFSYFGLIFDLAIGFLLWIIPKNKLLIVAYFGFHISNYFLFNIGEFPLVMMAAWLLFPVISTLPKSQIWVEIKSVFKVKSMTRGIVASFFIIQLVYPLRPILNPMQTTWTHQGYNFTWRMMLNNYQPHYFQFLVTFPESSMNYHVDFEKLLTYRQFYHAYHDPFMIWTLAQKLKKDATNKYKINNVNVFCRSFVQLNQHAPQELINPEFDLCTVKFNHFGNNEFILKFKQ